MIGDALKTRNSDEYSTPQNIFDQLNNEFSFTLDPCATEDNHKCEKYYSLADDGLKKDWGGRVFCNPPYSKIAKWVKKCYQESLKPNTVVAMLIPARTDTKYFHDYIWHRSEVRFIKGRLRFNDAIYNAPFPSMVVIFRSPGM